MKRIVLLTLLLGVVSNVFCQNTGRITYRITTDLSSFETKFKKYDDIVSRMKARMKMKDSLNLFLDFNNEKSIFYVDDKTNLGFSNEKGYSSLISTFKIFYRDDKNKIKLTAINTDGKFLVQKSIGVNTWKITKEKKKIGEYSCIKATKEVKEMHPMKGMITKEITAWFCPKIPIRLGPNNYGGLPGLIMELKDGKLTYYVKKINLKPNFDIVIYKPKGKVITEEAYFKKVPTITKDNIKEYIGN